MTDARLLVLDLTVVEAAHLHAVTQQFLAMVEEPAALDQDPAIARLAPDAYPDDERSSRDFRRLTAGDLLTRRARDARTVLDTLAQHGPVPAAASLDETTALEVRTVTLDADETGAWMRTLAAVRLVMASRLGIEHDDDDPGEDPRGILYDWLGQRLDALVAAADAR